MNSKEMQQRWPTLQEKILQERPELTAEDLVYIIGQEEELLLRLGEKLKMNKKEIDRWLSMMG